MRNEKTAVTYASPDASILRGRVDAVLVLVLWVLRRASWALLFVGFAIALWRGDVAAALELDTFEEALDAILSPLAPLALAVLFRLGVVVVAFVSAYPIGLREAREVPGHLDGDVSRRISTVWRVTTAHRSRRWTWPVRSLAVERAGRPGRVLDVVDRVFAVLTVVAAVTAIVVLFVQP